MSDKKGILVVAEPKDGKLANVTLESITGPARLAGAVGGPVSVVVMAAEAGPLAAQAARYGAERVYTVESPELARLPPRSVRRRGRGRHQGRRPGRGALLGLARRPRRGRRLRRPSGRWACWWTSPASRPRTAASR